MFHKRCKISWRLREYYRLRRDSALWKFNFTAWSLYTQVNSTHIHYIGGWVCHRVRLYLMEGRKFSYPCNELNSNSSAVQSVDHRSTDWTIPAPFKTLLFVQNTSILYLYLQVWWSWSLLLSSGQSSWLQIRRPGFDSQHYQKKK
jgi:hypothetical protein